VLNPVWNASSGERLTSSVEERAAMTSNSKRTRAGIRFMGMLKNALEAEDGSGAAALCHYLPVAGPEGSVPAIYTVVLTPRELGAFLVTCRELSEVSTFGASETEALSMAALAIEEALGVRRCSPEFPY
jgi:predicted RNase H-like HicB family nuclease